MKRYNIVAVTFKGIDDYMTTEAIEEPDGKWVKYDDVYLKQISYENKISGLEYELDFLKGCI